MGKLAPSSRQLSHRRPIPRPPRWQESNQTPRSPFRRTLTASHQRQNAHPLPGKRRQSPPVPPRTEGTPGEHGLARYRGREPASLAGVNLDHHPALPDSGYHDRGDGQPGNQVGEGRFALVVSDEDGWVS